MKEDSTRKLYLDNIRWITIILVVIFHIYFYYNNIGIEAMFEGAEEYTGQITFAGIFQYFVYPWFMLLLFVVSGMSAGYALKHKTEKQFLHSRMDKLLVPSTLGVLAFGWIGGYVIYVHNASAEMPAEIPGFVRIIIILCTGIGALWFCHVLFIASLVLLLVRKIIRSRQAEEDCICDRIGEAAGSAGKCCLLLVLLYLIFWGGSHLFNMPLITAYRNGIYIPAFLAGYYVFSNEKVMERLQKMTAPLLILSCASGIFYISRCYGLYYGDAEVLTRWDVNLYAFFMVLFVLGAASRFLNFRNRFTDYMNKRSFGIYVLHIPVLLVTNYLLTDSHASLPVIYLIELISALAGSILLYEIIRRIPVLRYWILGIRKK